MSSIVLVLVVVVVLGFCSLVPKLRTCSARAAGPAPTDLASVEPGIGHYRDLVVNHRPTEASSVVAGVACIDER